MRRGVRVARLISTPGEHKGNASKGAVPAVCARGGPRANNGCGLGTVCAAVTHSGNTVRYSGSPARCTHTFSHFKGDASVSKERHSTDFKMIAQHCYVTTT